MISIGSGFGLLAHAIRRALQKLDGSERQLKTAERQLKTVMQSMRVLERDHAELKLKYNEIVKIISGHQVVNNADDVERLLRKVLPVGTLVSARHDGSTLTIRIGPTRFN